PAVGPGDDRVDAHLERHPGPGSADLDRADQGMAHVELRVARLEAPTGLVRATRALHAPVAIERAESDGVPGAARERGPKVAREVAVERAAFGLDRMQRHEAGHPSRWPTHAARVSACGTRPSHNRAFDPCAPLGTPTVTAMSRNDFTTKRSLARSFYIR